MKQQHKWGITVCLLATLSFNLGHLFDGSAGRLDLASTEGGVTDVIATEKLTPAKPAKKLSHQGKVNVSGAETNATIIDIGNGKATFVIDKKADPRKALCDSCGNGVFTSDINYTSAIEDLSASMEEAEKIILASVPNAPNKTKSKESKIDLSTIAPEDMTDDQKDQRADDLLAEIEDSCGEIEKDAAAVKCYTSKLKSTLKDSENKKIFGKNRQEKVEDFISENVKEKISSSLTESKFSESSADQIEKLHKALPGHYKDARKMIIEASVEAAKTAAVEIKNKENMIQELDARIADPNTPLQSKQRSLNRMQTLMYEVGQMKQQFGPKVTSLLERENQLGLNHAVKENFIEENFRDQLMDRYDDLTSRLFESNTSHTNGSLVPTSKRFVEGNSNGVQRLQFGQKLQIPGGSSQRSQQPGSVGNQLNENRQQNNGSFSRPPAPQLNPGTGSVGNNNVPPAF